MKKAPFQPYPIVILIVVVATLAFGTFTWARWNSTTVQQVEMEIDRGIPIGSTRNQAKAWLKAQGLEYCYSDDPGAWSELVRTEHDLSRFSGALVSIIRDADRSLPVTGNIQVFTLLDQQGKVAVHRVAWVGTGP